MIAFIILTSIVSPPLLCFILWINLTDQKDQYGVVTKTAKQARRDVGPMMLKHWGAIIYYIWIALVSAFVLAYM